MAFFSNCVQPFMLNPEFLLITGFFWMTFFVTNMNRHKCQNVHRVNLKRCHLFFLYLRFSIMQSQLLVPLKSSVWFSIFGIIHKSEVTHLHVPESDFVPHIHVIHQLKMPHCVQLFVVYSDKETSDLCKCEEKIGTQSWLWCQFI